MPAITHTPGELKFKKLPVLNEDGEQWEFFYIIGKSVDFYKNIGKLFDNDNHS